MTNQGDHSMPLPRFPPEQLSERGISRRKTAPDLGLADGSLHVTAPHYKPPRSEHWVWRFGRAWVRCNCRSSAGSGGDRDHGPHTNTTMDFISCAAIAGGLPRSRRYTQYVSVHCPFGLLWHSHCPPPWPDRALPKIAWLHHDEGTTLGGSATQQTPPEMRSQQQD